MSCDNKSHGKITQVDIAIIFRLELGSVAIWMRWNKQMLMTPHRQQNIID
ncbi:MAG: hypothetical protein ACRCZS_29535 [Chroococcidiopsis sp.]